MSDLSSSASLGGSLQQASSTAVMYAFLGGYLGTMAKLGPLAKSDSCAVVRSVLVRLMTHFSLVVWLVLVSAAVGVTPLGAGAVGAEVLVLKVWCWKGWVDCFDSICSK